VLDGEDLLEAVEMVEFDLVEAVVDFLVVLGVDGAAGIAMGDDGFAVGFEGVVEKLDDGEVIGGDGAGGVDGECAGADGGFVFEELLFAGDWDEDSHGAGRSL
jgi:hypothetical protein